MFVVLVVFGSLLFSSLPAHAGTTSSGQWTFTHGPITCTFSGIHSASGGVAYARTNDANNGCASLRVNLKYKRSADGAIFITGWYETGSGSAITVWAGSTSTAVASQHRAENGWYGYWSPIQQPHAW
jgi:hypothetical protein